MKTNIKRSLTAFLFLAAITTNAWAGSHSAASNVTPVDTRDSAILDTDQDGMPDVWELAQGLCATNAADATLDQDDDGVNNLAEFRSGTDAQDKGSCLRVPPVQPGTTNGPWVVWPSVPDRFYTVQRAFALGGTSAFTNVAEHLLSTPPQNTWVDADTTNAPRFFYRIQVE